MTVRQEIDITKTPTKEQVEMLERAKSMPVTYDEDLPEFTDEQLEQFRRVSEINRENRRKQSVTLRLSPQALKKAKSLGKGYTSVLSRILESALEDNQLIERYL